MTIHFCTINTVFIDEDFNTCVEISIDCAKDSEHGIYSEVTLDVTRKVYVDFQRIYEDEDAHDGEPPIAEIAEIFDRVLENPEKLAAAVVAACSNDVKQYIDYGSDLPQFEVEI